MEALLKSKHYDGPFNMEDIVVEYQHDKGKVRDTSEEGGGQ